MTCAGFEDFERGVGGDGVDVEEGDDGGCVERVDLLLPGGTTVSRFREVGGGGGGEVRTGVTRRRIFVTYSSIVGKVTQYWVPFEDDTSPRVERPMMSLWGMQPWWVSTCLELLRGVLRTVLMLSVTRRRSTMSPSVSFVSWFSEGLDWNSPSKIW